MKKLVSLLMVFIMITAVCTSVSASEAVNSENVSNLLPIHQEKIKNITGKYQENIVVKKISDLSGNEFELIETGTSGYYIFDKNSGKYIEYSENAPSPYLGKTGELIYIGSKSYYIKNNKSFSHTVLSREKEKSKEDLLTLQKGFNMVISQCREKKDNVVLSLMDEIENTK